MKPIIRIGELFSSEEIAEMYKMCFTSHSETERKQDYEKKGTLARVAHDLNNALAVVQGNAWLLLQESELTNSAKDLAAEIMEASKRAAAIGRDLPDLVAHP